MKRYIAPRIVGIALIAVFGFMGCNENDNAVMPEQSAEHGGSDASLMKVGRGTIWADCTLFNTVGTPAHFNPSSGPFDKLFNIDQAGGHFKDGVIAISESKPGDQDFNGGRWEVYFLKSSVDNTKYENACSVGDLDMNDWELANVYFECPLIPMNRRP